MTKTLSQVGMEGNIPKLIKSQVLLSSGCCNKTSRPGAQTTEMDFLTVLEEGCPTPQSGRVVPHVSSLLLTWWPPSHYVLTWPFLSGGTWGQSSELWYLLLQGHHSYQIRPHPHELI